MKDQQTLEAYCVKCKAKNTMANYEVVTSTNSRRMAKGPCPKCKTTMVRILGKKD